MVDTANCTIFDIKKYAIHDGPGIRTTVFFKGCPLSCMWCHNPEGISLTPQVIYDEKRCIGCMACIEVCPDNCLLMKQKNSSKIFQNHSVPLEENKAGLDNFEQFECKHCGACADICPSRARELVGKQHSVNTILRLIKKDIPFYENSKGGVTFSGGEPLMQWEALLELLKGCRDLEIHTAVDTTGFALWPVLEKIAAFTDLFLFDLKMMDDQRHKFYTGVSNQLILSNLEKLSMQKSLITIRIPLIPGVNDDNTNIDKTGQFILSLTDNMADSGRGECVTEVHLLPYHDFQQSKYSKFGIEYRAQDISPPTDDLIGNVKNRLHALGLKVVVQN